MATGENGVTYGVGASAEKMNVGPAVNANSKLTPEGKVIDKDGNTVFDPSVDAVEITQPDPEIDYHKGVGLPSEDAEPEAGA